MAELENVGVVYSRHAKLELIHELYAKCQNSSVCECVTDVTSTNEPRLHAPAYIKAWQNQI